jgi:SAM-dependent methyltransferase
MWTDVINLRDFYSSSIGQIAQRAINQKLRELWPDLSGYSILGLGYGIPYLKLFSREAERTLSAMPAAQGVLRWPEEESNLTTLVDEIELPFSDLSIDRVLLIHALEYSDHIHPLLREIWRILSGSGKLIVVAPNRRGLWAQLERTPFGHGQPYSPTQLSRLLRDNLFTPIKTHHALFVPPSDSKIILSSASAWEQLGQCAFKSFSGVILTEAEKKIYATGTTNNKKLQRRYFPAHEQTPRI